MQRRQITAAVIDGVDRLLAIRLDYPTIATRLGISEYIVGVVDGDELGKGRPQPKDLYRHPAVNPADGVDTATIRMIRRMLQVSVLTRREIAREASVSLDTVEDVAMGRRIALSTRKPIIFKDLGERFLERPVRCSHCGAMLSIAPCRACRALCS